MLGSLYSLSEGFGVEDFRRFVTASDRLRHLGGQYPFASILGCADSRVSPEVIFDQGQGDLFVVRVAGQVVGEFEIASLEYSVQHLGVKLILVMGHENCGAVKAAISTFAKRLDECASG